MTSPFIPPTLEEIEAGATVHVDVDDEIDNLLDQGFTSDDLQNEQAQKATQKMDDLVNAIMAISFAAKLVGVVERHTMLMALVPMVQSLNIQEGSPEMKRVCDTLVAGGWYDPAQNNKPHEFLEACQLEPPTPIFQPHTFEELEAMPPKEWIIDQVLGRGDLAMLYGPPGCGKTFGGIDLAICAFMGKQWAMRFDIFRSLNVAYCAGEGISGLPARFVAAATQHGATKADKRSFTFFKTIPQFYTGDDTAESVAICRFVDEWKRRQEKGEAKLLDLLIIDTLHTATVAADENSAKDMGKVLSMCRWATQELGCAIVLVHHTNKGGSAERGSSALRGAMDCMIEIKRISDNGTKAIMHCAKLKDGEAWKDQTFDLVAVGDSVRVWWDEPSDSNQSKGREDAHRKTMVDFMQANPGKKFTAKILAEVAGIGQNNAIRILSKAVNDGQCVSELMDTTKQNSSRNPLAYFANLP